MSDSLSNALDPWSILDTLPDYLAVLDAGGTIRYLNAAWQQLFGADSSMRTGASYLAGFETSFAASDIDMMAVQAGLRELMAGERERMELEFPYDADGQRRWRKLNTYVGVLLAVMRCAAIRRQAARS